MKCILTAFLLFSLIIIIILIANFNSADFLAVYTRNTLSWDNTEVLDDGTVSLGSLNGKTTVKLKNDVKGNIGYNIYLYSEEASDEVKVNIKDVTEINKNEFPYSLNNYDVKCAYRGYLKGNDKKVFEITSTNATDLKLLIIIEDNNSYPKEEENLPTIANVKFSAEVLLDGQYPRGKDYSFSLKNAKGEVIETVHNDDGYISFSNIALKKKGTFTYYLSQNEGKNKKTSYDNSVYKINVVVEEKNVTTVTYEKGDTPIETLPRFSNYKEITDIQGTENPVNEKKSNEQPNYLLITVIAISFLLILLYITAGKKKG